MQIEHFHIHAIFLCIFVPQAIVSNHLKQIISNTNQYALSFQSFPKFKSFPNYSNILKVEREFENKPKIIALIPIFGISTSMWVFLLVSPYSNMMSAKLIYVLSSFHMLFCAFYIHIHVKLIKFPLNLVL